jgi:hypothetical protein
MRNVIKHMGIKYNECAIDFLKPTLASTAYDIF